MRSRLMLVLALGVLMLPLLNACAATQDASVPSLTARAAATISAAETAHIARTSALKASKPAANSSAARAASGEQPLWQELINRAKALQSSGGRQQETATQPFWDTVLNRIKALHSGGTSGQDAFSLPSIWNSVYQAYRDAQLSRTPGGLHAATPQ